MMSADNFILSQMRAHIIVDRMTNMVLTTDQSICVVSKAKMGANNLVAMVNMGEKRTIAIELRPIHTIVLRMDAMRVWLYMANRKLSINIVRAMPLNEVRARLSLNIVMSTMGSAESSEGYMMLRISLALLRMM